MERADVNCILCGSPERNLLIRKGEWTVYRCGACGRGFLDPRPDPMNLAISTVAAISMTSMVMALHSDPPR